MKILVACEFSGIVRDALVERGHDATSCDLIESDNAAGKHYKGNVFDIINQGWDMMIAHPPCTYLCCAGQGNIWRWREKGAEKIFYEKRDEAIRFFLKLMDAPIKRIAIENPIGIMGKIYRRPDQLIYPWMFGHNRKKDICLWLKNLPPLLSTSYLIGNFKRLDFSSKYRNINGRSRKSITFKGVAEAMSEQWAGSPSHIPFYLRT